MPHAVYPNSPAPPVVANLLHDLLPNEPFDPNFRGQALETTYFHTAAYDLHKARLSKSRYLTLRIRCYESPDGDYRYALAGKTESEKYRAELTPGHAELLLSGGAAPAAALPAHLQARLTELGADTLVPVVAVCGRRYAVEDDQDRLTLDCCVHIDREASRLRRAGVQEHRPGCRTPWSSHPPRSAAAEAVEVLVGDRRVKIVFSRREPRATMQFVAQGSSSNDSKKRPAFFSPGADELPITLSW